MTDTTKSATVKTLDGSTLEITSQALSEFQARVHGALLTPDDDGYTESRTIWNGMIDRHPGLIARCVGVADVTACVNFAREHNLLLSIRGGGHNISGLAVCDGAMMIDMSLMRGVWIDKNTATAHAQAGCTLGNVDRETQLHGQAAVLGFVTKTGITGLTLGGGFGYLSRKYGWTSDNVVSMDMVSAEGRFVRASEEENSDLFWSLRGGGGNFGVVTGIQYKLYPVGPQVMAGAIAWPGDHAAEVLRMYGQFMQQAPPELNCVAALRKAPPAPWLSPDVHGKLIIALFFIYAGSLEEGEKLAAPIKAFGSPVGDVIQPRPYLSQQSILDATQPNGRRYYWKSEYLPGFSHELFEKVFHHAQQIVSPHSAVILFPVDGALNNLPQSHSAVGNRDARLVLNITASWENAADDEKNISWARTAWSDMRSLSTGGTYINFLTEEEVGDRVRDAYGENYQRLVDAKTKWDPDNFFRLNKNISPQVK
jgi:FAD/FMN-containing dehydrogenase